MIVYDGHGERLVTAEEVAELAGITLRTFHNYHQTGRAPKPDGWVGRTPLWRDQTVQAWLGGRATPNTSRSSWRRPEHFETVHPPDWLSSLLTGRGR